MVFPGKSFACLLVLGKLGLLYANLGSEDLVGQDEKRYITTQIEHLAAPSHNTLAWHNSSSHQARRVMAEFTEGGFTPAVSSSTRRLLEFDSTTVPISNSDRQEGQRMSRGCAVSLTVTIGRGCSVISETIPFYYIDQVSRSVIGSQSAHC